jgi:hypothetical protein
MNTFKRLIASLVIVSTALLGFPLAAQASVVTTEEAISAEATDANRDRVAGFLARDDVRAALEQQGISADVAAERVRAMSDVEVAQLADRVGQAPAGGSVLGILFTVFVVLLVTDILGFTKIFPFTRSIR